MLANIYLHVLDSYWKSHDGLGEIVRYADDAVIICRTKKDAELVYSHLKHVMEKLKLTLNPKKTKIVDMNHESFDFLGFRYQKFKSPKTKRMLPYMMPSSKALSRVRDVIREIICRKSTYECMESKVRRLNPLIRGLRNYFKHGNSTKRFIQLDEYVWMKLWRRKYYRRKQKKYREKVLCALDSGMEKVASNSSIKETKIDTVMFFECVRKKIIGKPCEGEPHARFEVVGDGKGDTAPLLDPTRVWVSSAKHIAESK